MCIRDRDRSGRGQLLRGGPGDRGAVRGADVCGGSSAGRGACLLYTSDAADDLLCVDLGGRRIIKKKKKRLQHEVHDNSTVRKLHFRCP